MTHYTIVMVDLLIVLKRQFREISDFWIFFYEMNFPPGVGFLLYYSIELEFDDNFLFKVSERFIGGLLDRSMALYFYKRLKTSLHKPRGNL